MDAEIRAAADDDRTRVGRVLVDALLHTPDARWIDPNPDSRAQLYRALAAPLFDFAMAHGQIDMITVRGQSVGAAVWWSHPQATLEQAYAYALAHTMDQLTPYTAERLTHLGAAIAEHYPDDDHEYLAYIGVLRHRQGQGYGGALLAHRLEHLDAGGHAAYLVATSPEAADLFTRHGFQVRPPSPIGPPDGPPLFGMYREASRRTR